MIRPLRLLSFAALAVSAAAAPALARPTRVALTRIEGDTAGLAKAVAGALDDSDLEVVSGKQVARAIERLDLGKALGDRDLARLADELEVDAVVKGAFDRRGHKLRFTIFTSGKKVKPFSLQVGNAGSDKFRKLVRTTLVAKLAGAAPPDDEPAGGKAKARKDSDEVADDDRPARGKKAKPFADETAEEDRSAKGKKAKATADEVAEDDRPAKGKKAKARADEVGEDKPAKTKAKAKASDEIAEDKSARTKAKAKANEVTEDDRPAKGKKAKGKADEVADEDKPLRAKPAEVAAGGSDHAARAKPGAAGAAADDAAKPSVEVPVPASDDDAPRTAKPRVAARDDEDPVPTVRADRASSSPGATHGANLAALRVDLGASMAGRSLQFTTTAFAGAPKPYNNAPVLGARAEAELYPLALIAPGSLLAGFGVAADYDRTVALTLRATEEMTVPLKITERHYSFGVRYRLAFGHRPTSPTLTLGAGYGVRTFAVDRGGLMTPTSIDLPDVDYRLFDPGLAFRLPIGGLFAITLGGRGLLVTSAGGIQRADQYGKASVLGATASAGFDVLLGSHVAVRVAAEATQLNFKFAGTGALANSRDGDSSTVEVRGATDRYYGGTATLAAMY